MTQQLTDMLRLRASYRAVFSKDSDDAQRVLRHLMRTAYISRCPFVQNDPYETALNVGSQRLVQSILRFVYANDDAIRQAIEQSHEQEGP